MNLFTRCFLCFLIPHEVCSNGSLICYSQKNNFATDTEEQGIDKQTPHLDFLKHFWWITMHLTSRYAFFFQPNLPYLCILERSRVHPILFDYFSPSIWEVIFKAKVKYIRKWTERQKCEVDPFLYFRHLFLFCSAWDRLILSEATASEEIWQY